MAKAGSKQDLLQECDLDWEAAPTVDAELSGAAEAVARMSADATGAAATSRQGTAPASGPPAGQTELGRLQLQPLAPLHALESQPAVAASNEAVARPAEARPAAVAAVAAAAAEPAGAAPSAGVAANADAAVRQQVELFVRAELHPLLKRQQISLALHDAGKCAHPCCWGVWHEVHARHEWAGCYAMPTSYCHAMPCHAMPSCLAMPPIQHSVCPPSPSRPCLPAPPILPLYSLRALHGKGHGVPCGCNVCGLSSAGGRQHSSPGEALPGAHAAAGVIASRVAIWRVPGTKPNQLLCAT